MTFDPLLSPWTAVALGLAVLGLLLGAAALLALWRVALGAFVLRALGSSLLLALGLLCGAVSLGLQGYQALTQETLAATIQVRPLGPQRFSARLRWADGREAQYELAGDELYVDAHILKWKTPALWLGLRTAYELDRIGGRYRDIEQERRGLRTVHALAPLRPVDWFAWRQRHTFLAPLLDAEYGSATFITADRPATLELRVSTTGLLMRDVQQVTK